MSKSDKVSSSGEFPIANCYLTRRLNILNLITKKKVNFIFMMKS